MLSKLDAMLSWHNMIQTYFRYILCGCISHTKTMRFPQKYYDPSPPWTVYDWFLTIRKYVWYRRWQETKETRKETGQACLFVPFVSIPKPSPLQLNFNRSKVVLLKASPWAWLQEEHDRLCLCPLHEEQGLEARLQVRTNVWTPAGGTYKNQNSFRPFKFGISVCSLLRTKRKDNYSGK